ncbi:MAG: creatininase family protein [Verrucomicrobia subdivision 3 bacterium]|nr:creatininase family protein [Limisphaerales bacterium]
MDLIELSWPAVAALSKDTPVVFPIAALEQHGHHLPLFTDSLLLGKIDLPPPAPFCPQNR